MEDMPNDALTNVFNSRESLEQMSSQYKRTVINICDIDGANIIRETCFNECLIIITSASNLILRNCKLRNCMLSLNGTTNSACNIELLESTIINCAIKPDDYTTLKIDDSSLKLCVMNHHVHNLSIRDSVIEKSNMDLTANDTNLQSTSLVDSIVDIYCKSFYLYKNRIDVSSCAKVHAWDEDKGREFSVTL